MSVSQKEKKLKEIYNEAERLVTQLFSTPPIFVSGYGDTDARILIVGEAPDEKGVSSGKPFSGKVGQYIRELMALCGLSQKHIYVTNVCKFRPCRMGRNGKITNRPPNREERALFLPFLEKETGVIAPEIIITLGNTAMRAMLKTKDGIGSRHGREERITVDKRSIAVYPLYHPLSAAHNRDIRAENEKDVARLKELLQQKGII